MSFVKRSVIKIDKLIESASEAVNKYVDGKVASQAEELKKIDQNGNKSESNTDSE